MSYRRANSIRKINDMTSRRSFTTRQAWRFPSKTFYDFAYKYIPEISSLSQCFSYYSDPVTQHVYVHADAEEMFDYHIGNPAAIVVLKQAFGDVEVRWLAAHSY